MNNNLDHYENLLVGTLLLSEKHSTNINFFLNGWNLILLLSFTYFSRAFHNYGAG